MKWLETLRRVLDPTKAPEEVEAARAKVKEERYKLVGASQRHNMTSVEVREQLMNSVLQAWSRG